MKNLLCIALLAFTLSACQKEQVDTTYVGILIPLEHQAMQEIVAGFTETLKHSYTKPISIEVKNAQSDLNLQRSILQQMNNNHDKIIVTIGLGPTQMATTMVHDKPILGLAASISEQNRKNLKSCHLAIVQDEISPEKLLTFIKTAYPKLKKISLVHSSSDKVYSEIKEAVAIGKKLDITITPKLASTLPELTSVAATLPTDTQAIVVLKDHLIVSGISILAKTAHQRHIPLISLDQGSVEKGAGFALAVHERDIGAEGAKLALAVLKGKSACDLPITKLSDLTVFINKNALEHQDQNILTIKTVAKQLNYAVEAVKK